MAKNTDCGKTLEDLIADQDEKEMQEIAESERAAVDADYDYLDQLAAARFAEQNGSPAGYAQDL